MVTQQLIDFIKEQLTDGKKEEDIRQTLSLHGWSEADIDSAFNMAKVGANIPSPPSAMPNYQMQNNNFTRDNKPKLAGIGQLFAEAWNIYKKNFWRFWLIMFIFGLTLAAIVFIILFGFRFLNQAGLAVQIISAIVLFLLAIFAGILVQVGALLVSGNNERPKTFKEIVKISFKKLFPFLWLSILQSLVIMGSTILTAPLIFLGMFGYLNLFFAIGLAILCLVPGIIMGMWFSMANYVLLFEKEKGINALLKSRYYVKNYWWAVFGRLLLIGLCPGAISIMLDYIKIVPIAVGLQIISGLFIAPIVLGYNFSVYNSASKVARRATFGPKSREKILYIILAIIALIGIASFFVFGAKILKGILMQHLLRGTQFTDQALSQFSSQQITDLAHVQAARSLANLLYTKNNSFDGLCLDNKLNNALPELSNAPTDINIDFCAASDTNYCVYSVSDNGWYICSDTSTAIIYTTAPYCSNEHITCK